MIEIIPRIPSVESRLRVMGMGGDESVRLHTFHRCLFGHRSGEALYVDGVIAVAKLTEERREEGGNYKSSHFGLERSVLGLKGIHFC